MAISESTKAKKCNICNETKAVEHFPRRKLKSQNYSFAYACKSCYYKRQKESRQAYKEQERERKRKYYLNNKEKILKNNKKWDSNNREYRSKKALNNYYANRESILKRKKENYVNNLVKYRAEAHKRRQTSDYKAWLKKNRVRLRERRREYYRGKRKDFCFRLRKNVSRAVNHALKNFESNKAGQSVMKFLSYSVKDLRNHLEGLFEPWMTWDNWGNYDPQSWDDENTTTWTWHIDHIIPQSKLPYDSMEHSNFGECWALRNLRPLASKENIIRGSTSERFSAQ